MQKTVCVRGLDVALYPRVKAQAKAEGMLVREWIERALTHELVRVHREQMRTEVGEKAAGAALERHEADGDGVGGRGYQIDFV
jgi:hypothetical protein